MNIRKGKARVKNFRILLDSICSSKVVMGRLIEKIHPEKDTPMHWNTQSRNITTNNKVKIDSTLPALSATNVKTWNCHVDDSTKDRYDMILGQYLLT